MNAEKTQPGDKPKPQIFPAEVIKAYIENQCHDHDAIFSIEGEASLDGESPSS